MKKITKIVLITSLVLGGVGLLLTGVGIVSGASFDTFATSTRGGDFSGRCLRNIGRMSRWEERWVRFEDEFDDFEDEMEDTWELEDKQRDKQYKNGHGEYLEPQSFPVGEVENLSVEVEAGSVRVQKGVGDEIVITNICKNDSITYESDDQELYIGRMCHHSSKEPLIIEIPEDKRFNEVEFEVSSGNMEVENKILAKEVSVNLESGRLKCNLLDSRETSVECLAGTLFMRHVGKLKDYRVEVEADSCVLDIDNQKHAGSINGTFGNEGSQKNIDIEGSSGTIEIDFEEN